MDIERVMTRDVEVVPPEATLREAAMKMRDINVGSLPVCNGRRLLGMITDRDITVRAVAAGRDPNQTPVSEAMSPEVVYAYEDQDVRKVAELMSEHQIRRLPILNRNNELSGIVALGDLAVDANAAAAEQILEDVSQPSRPAR